MKQKDCVALRIYQGADDNGKGAPILVGVDGAGKDLTGGILLQMGFPCPPWCDAASALKG